MGLAIVTGASRGIGRVLALRLANAGHTVAAIARSEPGLQALASEHPSILARPIDVTDEPAIAAAVQALIAEHGPCEILVNNAGYGLRAAVEELPLDAWRREFEVNLFAATHLIQRVLPGMREAGRGTIVNISSVAGRIATPFSGGYAATKFALEGMSDALRLEVERWGIAVVLVEPGPVSTEFASTARAGSEGVVTNPDSAYAAGYRHYLAQVERMLETAWTAEQVADATMAAIAANSPPRRVLCCDARLRLGLLLRAVAPGLLDQVLLRQGGARA